MRVLCINNAEIISGSIPLLTTGKIYEVIKINGGQYYIEDNSGAKRWYNDFRFKDIAEIRQEKLEQLGI